jgi:hypothetical protein
MPDGGVSEDFLHIAGLVQVLSGHGGMRPCLLVGIENTERRRDLTGPTTDPEDRKIAKRVGGSAAFRRFLRDELRPVVDKRYRTNGENAVVGESLAGLFVVETMLVEPDAFDYYLAVDPSLWWNRSALVERANNPLQTSKSRAKRLYLACSGEPSVLEPSQRLIERLREKLGAPWTVHFKRLPEETHATVFHPAALAGLRTLLPPEKLEGRP